MTPSVETGHLSRWREPAFRPRDAQPFVQTDSHRGPCVCRLALRWVRSFPFTYHLRMRNLLSTVSPFHASAMRRGFLRLRGFCALSPVAQAAAFRPAAVSPAPTFSWCGVSCALFNPRPTRRSSGPAQKAAQPA